MPHSISRLAMPMLGLCVAAFAAPAFAQTTRMAASACSGVGGVMVTRSMSAWMAFAVRCPAMATSAPVRVRRLRRAMPKG